MAFPATMGERLAACLTQATPWDLSLAQCPVVSALLVPSLLALTAFLLPCLVASQETFLVPPPQAMRLTAILPTGPTVVPETFLVLFLPVATPMVFLPMGPAVFLEAFLDLSPAALQTTVLAMLPAMLLEVSLVLDL